MSERGFRPVLLATLVTLLAACGQKGPLYLPERAGEVVTRPASAEPEEQTQGPNTPQTIDSPEGPPNPAPEVTRPAEDPKQDDAKKRQEGAAPPP